MTAVCIPCTFADDLDSAMIRGLVMPSMAARSLFAQLPSCTGFAVTQRLIVYLCLVADGLTGSCPQ